MVSFRASFAALGVAAVATAQTPQIPGTVTCDGRRWPNWDACAVLLDVMVEGGPVYDPVPEQCLFADFGGQENCAMRVCWGEDPHERATAHVIDIIARYDRIYEHCEADRAGGWVNSILLLEGQPTAWQLAITNDPDWNGNGPDDSAARHSGRFNATELLNELADSSETKREGVHVWSLSHDNMQAFLDAEAAAEAEAGNPDMPTIPLPTENAETEVVKRQDDDDVTFYVLSISNAIVNPDERTPAGPILGPGAEYTWEVSESTSVGISVSVGLEAGFWGIFTASMGIELSSEFTVSYSESYKFTSGNCNRGQNYFYPLFDRVRGYRSDETFEDTIDVWIPRGGDDIDSPVLEYLIETECLGSLE